MKIMSLMSLTKRFALRFRITMRVMLPVISLFFSLCVLPAAAAIDDETNIVFSGMHVVISNAPNADFPRCFEQLKNRTTGTNTLTAYLGAYVDRITYKIMQNGFKDAVIRYEIIPTEQNRCDALFIVDPGKKYQISGFGFIWDSEADKIVFEPAVTEGVFTRDLTFTPELTNMMRIKIEHVLYEAGMVPSSVGIEAQDRGNSVFFLYTITNILRAPVVNSVTIITSNGMDEKLFHGIVRFRTNIPFKGCSVNTTQAAFNRNGYTNTAIRCEPVKATAGTHVETNMVDIVITVVDIPEFRVVPFGVRSDNNGIGLVVSLGEPNMFNQGKYLGLFARYGSTMEDYFLQWVDPFSHSAGVCSGLSLGLRRRSEFADFYNAGKLSFAAPAERNIFDVYASLPIRLFITDKTYLEMKPELSLMSYFETAGPSPDMPGVYSYIKRGYMNNTSLRIGNSTTFVLNTLNADYLPTSGFFGTIGMGSSFLMWTYLKFNYRFEGLIPLAKDSISLHLRSGGGLILPFDWQPDKNVNLSVPKMERSQFLQMNRLHGWQNFNDFASVREQRNQAVPTGCVGDNGGTITQMSSYTVGLSEAYHSVSLDVLFWRDKIGCSFFVDAWGLGPKSSLIQTFGDYKKMLYSAGGYLQFYFVKAGAAYDFLYDERVNKFTSRTKYLSKADNSFLNNVSFFIEFVSYPIQ